jgi:hypothetical protein
MQPINPGGTLLAKYQIVPKVGKDIDVRTKHQCTVRTYKMVGGEGRAAIIGGEISAARWRVFTQQHNHQVLRSVSIYDLDTIGSPKSLASPLTCLLLVRREVWGGNFLTRRIPSACHRKEGEEKEIEKRAGAKKKKIEIY